ncbi:hypothetical protein DUI87_11472 [Hirundo rustica rustica]|uniref:GDNF/GAS1 domain-containing protein n=1 Tax=Hirundo rustica rustica TaxID=333673 RepID=A0A3M0KDP1_HIRRU|nr:hypothetical protein DUI87_11472 [Hirundo rustica rustica]
MFLVLLYFALPLVEVSGLPGGDRLDCVKASDQCLKEQSCSTKFRTLRQCVAGKESNFSRATGLEAKDECRSAMEALKQKSLYNCRCRRGMKKEKNCLRIYWSMYQSLQGNDLLEDSPYEPVNSRLSDIFRLAPIVSVLKQDMIEDSEVSAVFEILLEIDEFACQISLKVCMVKSAQGHELLLHIFFVGYSFDAVSTMIKFVGGTKPEGSRMDMWPSLKCNDLEKLEEQRPWGAKED